MFGVSTEMVAAVLPLYVIVIGDTAVAVGLVDDLSNCAASLAKDGMTWCGAPMRRPNFEQAMNT